MATKVLIEDVLRTFAIGGADLPAEGHQFSDAASAFQRFQQYAFSEGFAVVETQKDEMLQLRVFSCVHYGKGKNKRKLTGDAVRKEIYQEMDGVDEKGQALRQQQGLVCGLADKVTRHLLIYFVG